MPKELPYATIGLALLYAVNNQLTFVILTLTNAGTLALFKAAAGVEEKPGIFGRARHLSGRLKAAERRVPMQF